MSLRKITKKKVVTVRPDDTVVKAAKLMEEKNVGSVVVVENRKPVGILTDRDIAIRVVAKKADINSILVKDVMTKKIVTGRDNQRVAELAKVMHENGIRRVPIVDKKGMLSGIITLDDLLYMMGLKARFF
ncbi:MAG TPA: CBS domain-containing protein [Thermodesulfobacteriota bacterium]|nr:CBS domain-containing protein [Thermodesulfobacteriota bacterium]